MKRSEQLKSQHSKLLAELKKLDSVEDQTPEQQAEVEKRFADIKALSNKIERQLLIEATEAPKPEDSIPEKEKRAFSFSKAMSVFTTGKLTGREKEISDELSKDSVRKAEQQFFVPVEMLLPKREKRAVGDGTVESALVSDPIRPELFLFALREMPLMDKLGIGRISGNGNFHFPRASATSSAWFSGLAPAAPEAKDKIAESDMTFSSQEVRPHFLATRSGWTMAQVAEMAGNLSLEEKIRADMQMSMAEELDDSLINADSVVSSAQPDGFKKLMGNDNNVALALKSADPNIRKWQWSDFVDLREELRKQYKNNAMMPMILMSPKVEAELAVEQRFNGTDGRSLLESVGSYAVSNHQGDDKLYYGAWNELILCTFGAISIERGFMNNDFELGISRIRAVLSADFFLNRKEGFRQITISRS